MNNNSPTNETEHQDRIARRKARTRADLLAAAQQVFAAKGYHDATIADITQAADVGVGTFYLHFRDKDEAFHTLLDEGFREMREQITNTLQQGQHQHTIPLVIRTVFRHAYEHRELFQIALTGGGQFTRARTFGAQSDLAQGLTYTLKLANINGLLDGYNLPLLARFITGMITQGNFWWFEHDEPGPDEMADQVLKLLRHGLPEQLLTEG
jgi:AcrR family transcriptional regulator